MYVLLYPFDLKMKLLVGSMLVLLFASEKIKILFRKPTEFVGYWLVGWFFFIWLCTVCAVFCFFIRKFMEKVGLLFIKSIKTFCLFVL